MSEELEKKPPEERAAAADDAGAGFTDSRPSAPAGEALLAALNEADATPLAERPPNTARSALMLAGIGIIVVGASLLIILGPTFTTKRPSTAAKDLDPVLRTRELLYKWDDMDAAARRAVVPELAGAFRIDDEDIRLNLLLKLPDAGKDAVPELVKGLKDEDFNVRFYAAWALGKIGPDAGEAVPALLEARTDPNGDVRRKAVFALGRIHPRAELAIPVLIETFADNDPDVQGAAVEALAGYGKEAVPGLVKELFSSPTISVRRQAILALTKIEPAAIAKAPWARDVLGIVAYVSLLRLLYLDPASGLQDEAAAALSSVGEPAIVALAKPLETAPARPSGQVVLGLGSPWALLGVWRDYAADHRRALAALGKIGINALDALLAALKNPNADVRKLAAGELGKLGYRDERIIGPLADALSDPEDVVRQQAGWALKTLSPDTRLLLPGLRRALQDPDADVRLNAVEFLGGLGTPATPLLVESLKDKEPRIYEQAAKALSAPSTSDEYVLEAVAPLLNDPTTQVRQNAVVVLRRGGGKALPLLVGALRDKEAAVRRDAIWSVVNIPGDEKLIQPALVEALADNDTYVRAEATAGLGKLGFKSLEHLRRSLNDKEPEVRLKAVEAIARLNPVFKGVFELVAQALRDKSRDVRLVAVAGLGRFGEKGIPLLIGAFMDADGDVWKRAKDVLINMEAPSKTLFADMVKAASDDNKFVRQGAVYVLANRFKAEAVPYLVKALKDSDAGVQIRAADALDDIGPVARTREAIAALAELAINHADEKTRGTAAMALTTLHGFAQYRREPAKAVPGLIDMLDGADAETRWSLVQTLWAIGPPAKSAIPALTKLLQDPEASVRVSARSAIDRISQK